MSFQAYWGFHFGDLLPLGHLLRVEKKDCWLRIHSLPESKRYPQSADEVREVLFRQNTVATEVLGENSACWLVMSRLMENEEPRAAPVPGEFAGAELAELSEGLEFKEAFSTTDQDGFSQVFWASPVHWRQGSYDPLIELVARDEERFLLVSVENAQVYAPYDGGADLILASRELRDRYKKHWVTWLSREPSGL